jgi:hypothetical protein
MLRKDVYTREAIQLEEDGPPVAPTEVQDAPGEHDEFEQYQQP